MPKPNRTHRRRRALNLMPTIVAELGEGARWEDAQVGGPAQPSEPGAEIRVWARDPYGRTFRVVWWPARKAWTARDGGSPHHQGEPEAFIAWLRTAVGDRRRPDPAHARRRQERRLPPLIRPARPPADDFDVIDSTDSF